MNVLLPISPVLCDGSFDVELIGPPSALVACLRSAWGLPHRSPCTLTLPLFGPLDRWRTFLGCIHPVEYPVLALWCYDELTAPYMLLPMGGAEEERAFLVAFEALTDAILFKLRWHV